MEKVILKMFINRSSKEQQAMVQELRKILKEEYEENFQLDIYDVQQDEQEARQYGILASPTIIRIQPQPERRFVGEISSREEVNSLLKNT